MIQQFDMEFPDVVERGLNMAGLYLEAALRVIDEICGEGFAKSNPLFVAAFMLAAASGHHGVILAQQLREGLREVNSGGDLIRELCAIGIGLDSVACSTRDVAKAIDNRL